jgi:polyisoprenoid-binding protein YceI
MRFVLGPMKLHVRALTLAAWTLGSSAALPAAVETYAIDSVHSSVGFSIRHFVAKVPGRFTKFSGTIAVDRENPANNRVNATIEAAAIDTGNQKRDTHLRNPDFLEVEKFPTINFKSTLWKKTGDETYDVTGDLTIKDVTKPVILKVTSLGFGPGSRGVELSGWEATTTINKKEFNVNDPALLEVALGDEVAVTINIEAKKT